MSTPSARFVSSLLGSVALMFSLAQGCATGDPEDTASGDDDSAVGGDIAGGGMGGSGGESLCDMDCANVNTPACFVAVCNDGTYEGTVGSCVVVADEGATCDDGLFCTIDETCDAEGVCGGGAPNECDLNAEGCQEVTCDEASDSCSNTPVADGTACTSTDLCLSGSTCQNGLCAGGTTNDCMFAPVPDDCHVAVCNPNNGECEPEPGNEGGTCDDPADLCTENKTCTSGVCEGGTAVDCSQLTTGCDLGVCDTGTGMCMTQALMMGDVCDDLDACTIGETCMAGNVCGGGVSNTTCSMVGDGCCPSNCTELNDDDCACPGTFVNGVCVFVPSLSTTHPSAAAAQAACQGIGNGWDLCSPTMLCDPGTITYLGGNGCDCSSDLTCACGSAANLYLHVTGGSSPYYVRDSQIPNCISGDTCVESVSETCGVALCCK